MRLDIVAKRLDLEPRKLLVEALDLLQAERVGRDLLQVVAEMADPLADGVDVPGGDAQGAELRKGEAFGLACYRRDRKGRAFGWGVRR